MSSRLEVAKIRGRVKWIIGKDTLFITDDGCEVFLKMDWIDDKSLYTSSAFDGPVILRITDSLDIETPTDMKVEVL